MLRLIATLDEKRTTATREMDLVQVECLNCGTVSRMLAQNFRRHTRESRKRCVSCAPKAGHGMSKTRIYQVWCGARNRAADTLDKNYGGRGISVSAEWQNCFETFWRDMGSSYRPGLTLERSDVNQGYSKENCEWVPNLVQQANKRNNRRLEFEGEVMHLADLCRATGVTKIKLTTRPARGMTPEEAVADARASTYGRGVKATGRRSVTGRATAKALLQQGRTSTTS